MKIKTACENCLPISFKAFKKILILIVIHLFFISPISGQIIDIKGHVELQDNLSDPIYTVVALRSDSSIYKGSVYMDSVFSMKLETDSLIGLQFSSMGYEALFYERDNIISAIKNKTANLGTISLKSNCMLDEVTITATRKSLSLSSTGYSVDVKNSYLSTYSTFDDVIKRIPGITVSPRGGIEVIGKTSPLFILNGRRLSSTADLERLDPKMIKTIHIDRNSGSEYDATHDVVVRVETSDYNQEFYSVDMRNNFEHGRRPSNNSRIIFQRKDKDFIYGVEAQYNLSQYKQYDTEEKDVWMNNDSVNAFREAVLEGKSKSLLLAPSMQWYINKNNRIEAIYNFTHQNYKLNTSQDYISTVLGEKRFIDTNLKQNEKINSHNPSLFYILEKDKHRLQLSVDYFRMNTDDNQKIKELSDDILTKYNQDFVDKYTIFGGAADYKTSIGKWSVSTGAKMSGIKDEGKYKTNDESYSTSSLKNNTYALYLGTSRKLSSFSFSAALRAEWNDINYSNSSYKDLVKSNFFNLFPSASVRYTKNSLNLSLAYNKRIRRPSFKQLNPNKSYLDPISYMVGNPLLKSRITHNLAFTLQQSNFFFTAVYGRHNNPLAGVMELTPENKIAYTDVNIPRIKFMDLIAIYYFNTNWFRSNILLQAKLQDIRFQDHAYSRFKDTPSFIGRINIDIDLWKNGSVNLMGYYYNNYRLDITKMKNSGYISFELNQSLAKNKLILVAGVSDAFKLHRPNTWTSSLTNASVSMDSNADSRYFYFTLQYRFGKMKNSRKANSIISDEKNRL